MDFLERLNDHLPVVHPIELRAWSKEHKLNSHGFRSDEFDERSDINVLAVGCSNVFGWGLRKDGVRFTDIFVNLIKKKTHLSVSEWNLGWCGKSNDYIRRVIYCATRVLKPDICIVGITDVDRREIFDIQYDPEADTGICDFLIAHYPKNVPDNYKHYYEAQFALLGPCEDLSNLFFNYKFIELFLNSQNVNWLFVTTGRRDPLDEFERYVDPDKYAGRISYKDRASDRKHPGPKSHRELGTALYQKYRETYGENYNHDHKML